MSIEGRINIDVMFHDRSGTASLKIVSLQDSKEYTTGKVAIVSGTVGTTEVIFPTSATDGAASTYRDASGGLVSLLTLSRVVVKATAQNRPLVLRDQGADVSMNVPAEEVLVYPIEASPNNGVAVSSPSGTASYTIILYGT